MEARNKDFKRFRLDFARKRSRKQNLEDVFHRFLVTSDPEITNIFRKTEKNHNTLPPEVKHMLVTDSPDSEISETETDDESEDDIDIDSSEAEFEEKESTSAEEENLDAYYDITVLHFTTCGFLKV